MKVFNKFEFFGAVTIALLGGVAIGYSKAREICLEAIINTTANNNENEPKEEES